MKLRLPVIAALFIAMTSASWADEAKDGPRTGYFRKTMTPLEMLGPDGAKSVAHVFEADQDLKWQLYVPHTYDPSKPAGVIVFINRWSNSGGSRKSYNDLLTEKNLIWAGVLDAGDPAPMDERIMRAILTPMMLSKEYALDPERIYVGGFSGGAHVATIVATGKPDMFKGGMFVGGTVSWDSNVPSGIELIRQNRYVFVAGSNDLALKTMQRTLHTYREEGVQYADLIVMANQRQEMPGPNYLREAIEFLDDPIGATVTTDAE